MKAFTSEDLIASVQRRASFSPDVESEGKTDQDLLDTLDEVMLEELVPAIRRFKEDYFLRSTDLAVAATPNRYPVPARAVGNALKDVVHVAADGTEEPLFPVARELLPYQSRDPTTVPGGFYFEGDSIRLVPPGSAGTLRLVYFFRPGQLVKAASYRQVVSVDSTVQVTLDSTAPTAWVAGTTLLDVHSKESGAEVRVFDYGASTIGATIIFTQAIDGTVDGTRAVEVGDYVVEAEHAAIPAIPRDAHPVLAQAAACRLLESDGDSEMLKLARETLAHMLDNLADLFETRVEGKPKVFVNRKSILFAQRGARW